MSVNIRRLIRAQPNRGLCNFDRRTRASHWMQCNHPPHRIVTTLDYADAEQACDAVFVGGPVALAWAHFPGETRARVRARYVEAIAPWRDGAGYRIPGEFVVVAARAPGR